MEEKILSLGNVAFYPKGTVLFEEGQSVRQIYFLKKGVIQLSLGCCGAFTLISQSGYLGMAESFSNTRFLQQGTAFTDIETVTINVDNLKLLTERNPFVRSVILKSLSDEYLLHNAAYE